MENPGFDARSRQSIPLGQRRHGLLRITLDAQGQWEPCLEFTETLRSCAGGGTSEHLGSNWFTPWLEADNDEEPSPRTEAPSPPLWWE